MRGWLVGKVRLTIPNRIDWRTGLVDSRKGVTPCAKAPAKSPRHDGGERDHVGDGLESGEWHLRERQRVCLRLFVPRQNPLLRWTRDKQFVEYLEKLPQRAKHAGQIRLDTSFRLDKKILPEIRQESGLMTKNEGGPEQGDDRRASPK